MNRWLTLALLSTCLVSALRAEPVVPRSNDEVIETLNDKASRTEERALRRAWAANPADARVAVALARRYLDQAHAQGDPRYAGRAVAALSAWPSAVTAPDDVLLLQATLQQYLHEFDPAAALLETLVARNPRHAQAWLTLATVRRVQGRLDASERACSGVASAGAMVYAQACSAENIGLRGDFDTARASLERLLLADGLPGSTRNWLLTSLAELEARAARPAQAERAYLAALQAQADAYTALSYSDFLMARGRAAEALAVLKDQPRSDVVLLRLAIVGTRAGAPRAPADVAELRERMAQAALRPDAGTTHAREQAMFALWVESRPERALELARANVQLQREPLDLWLLAEAARATGRATDVQDARRIVKEAGLHDKRLDALL